MGNVLADALIRLEIEAHMREKDEYNAQMAALKAENEVKREQMIAGLSKRESTNDVKASNLPDTFQPSAWNNNERLLAQRLAVKQYMDTVGYQDMWQASKTKALVDALHEAERKIDTGREYDADTIEYGETAYRSDTNALINALKEAERQQHTTSGLLTDTFTNTNKNGIINITKDEDIGLALSEVNADTSNPGNPFKDLVSQPLETYEQYQSMLKQAVASDEPFSKTLVTISGILKDISQQEGEETNSPKWELTGGPTTYWYRLTLNKAQAKQFVQEMRRISDKITLTTIPIGGAGFRYPLATYAGIILTIESINYNKLATDIENEMEKNNGKNIVLIMMLEAGHISVVHYE